MRPPSRIVVPEEAAGSRLDVFLARRDPDLSRSLYQRVIAEGRVRLHGRPAKKWDRVAAGDVIEIEPFELPSAGPVPDPSVPLVVVHEDEAVIVVDKPCGIPVHPHRPGETGTLANALVARYPQLRGVGPQPLEPGLVHRLDTDTSGLLVVARTPAAFRALAAQFAERRVEKVYIALVLGSAPATGTITTPVGHHPTDRRRMIVEGDPAGPPRSPRPAVTHFAVLHRYAGYTELEVRIDTGRMHQIRVHLASIGHPIAGDALYQTPDDFRRDRLGLSRPFLHAVRLTFDHPVDGRRVTFSAPLPLDLVTALARLSEAQPDALPQPVPPAATRATARKAAGRGSPGASTSAARRRPAPRFIRRPGGGRREGAETRPEGAETPGAFPVAPPLSAPHSSAPLHPSVLHDRRTAGYPEAPTSARQAPTASGAPSWLDPGTAERHRETREEARRPARAARDARPGQGAQPRGAREEAGGLPGPRSSTQQTSGRGAGARLAGTPRPGEVFGPGAGRLRRGNRQERDARRAGALKPFGRSGRPASRGPESTSKGKGAPRKSAPPRRGAPAVARDRQEGEKKTRPGRTSQPADDPRRRPRR